MSFSGKLEGKKSVDSETTVTLDADQASLEAGGNELDGKFVLRDNTDKEVFQVEGQFARLNIGTQGKGGDIRVRDGEGNEVCALSGPVATLGVGTQGRGGNLVICDNEGKVIFNVNGLDATVHVGALGAKGGHKGDFRVRDVEGREVIKLDGQYAALYVG